MTAEWIRAVAAVATFCVVGISALLALRPLGRLRDGSQITVFTELRHAMNEPEFQEALRFIREEIPRRQHEPEFRTRMLDRRTHEAQMVQRVGTFLDGSIAPLVKHGVVDCDLACDMFYFPVVLCWDTLAPYIATRRAELGYRMWDEFEYLTLLCKEFRARHPRGTFPRGAKALPLPDPWPDYATSGRSHSTTSPSPEISSEGMS